LIDFGGTLDADGLRWAARFHAAYRRVGGTLSLRRFEPIFRASDRALEHLPDIRGMGFRAMIDAQAVLLRDLLSPIDPAAVDASRVAEAFHAQAVRTVERNRPVLEVLRARFRLAVISNFTGNLDRCLDELGIRSFFDVVTDSAVHGVAKPDPVLFRRTLDALGVSASDACMIGDNLIADIAAARDLGMRTIWIVPRRRSAPAGPQPTARVARFADLPGVLLAPGVPCTA
jgi:putative hydrolase of the HAD superfamily